MKLTKQNFMSLTKFIKAIFPYAKTPTTVESAKTWIDDLSEYDLITILEAIRVMQKKDIFFTYQNFIKKVKGVVRGRELGKHITNQDTWIRYMARQEKQAKDDYERFFK